VTLTQTVTTWLIWVTMIHSGYLLGVPGCRWSQVKIAFGHTVGYSDSKC
jgi:hypothetical protein